ncbi:PREDICTED: uncharacterized protein LOC105958070, partial [Erythranthe guttata]|uniref:uncharacterized protein LOC105958070 n=1 Tax=Erythranthe guttata TaxID=4155 RepID=UPI00064D901E
MARSHKTIDSVTRVLDMTSVPAMLVDEDLQTLRDISSDSGDSEYVSNDENSDDAVDDTDYEDLGDQTYECPFCGAMMHVTSINNGSGPYTFLLHGQNYHLLGSLLPEEGTRPKFAQLYIFDTENEIQNGIDARGQQYRAVRDRFSNDGHQGVKLRLVKSRSTDGRTYNLPNASEIAGLIVGDFDTQEGVRDIVVETRSNKLQRISELHPLYLPLQNPLLFPYSEDGYRDDISLRESSFADNRKRRKFCVDRFSMVESHRLNIRFNQDQLRIDMYKGIEEKIFKRDTEGKSVGQGIIIPGSFTAGPRYMFNNFVDALQIYNWIGFPTLFITIACNPQWPEIQRVFKDTNLRSEDRPDILCRVFKMQLDSMMTEIKKGRMFGRIRASQEPRRIDRIICAEIPDKENDRKMYQLVEKYMIHGPCGQENLKSPCMNDRVCTKRFPKPFVQRTESDADGFTVYRRREDGRTVTKKKTTLDNGFVVPYNRILLSKYRAHINIELCNQNKSIKYLFKYVNKGHDRVTAAFYETRNTDGGAEIRDEIKMYYDCRYLPACEAMWRLFNFNIHYRDPSVIRLSFNLPDHQPPVFNENQSLQSVLDRPSAKQTMFLAWFEANKNYPHARDLRYACYVLGLLDDDKEYINAIIEVNTWASGDYIRRLFAVMLLSNSLSRPEHVWQSCWLDLAEGIAYKQQRLHKNPDLHISDESLKNYTLTEIEKILQSNGKSLRNYAPMPVPIESSDEDTVNTLVLDELDYDRFEMGRELQQCLASITDDQRKVYDVVMDVVSNDSGGMFFLYGHGGTGKTFLWKTLSAAVRSKGKIVINVASSGIASLLLPVGRTAHSRFGLPINVDKPFGGKVVVIGGDFRQILPVVLKASMQDIVHATINPSPLWNFCRVMKLTKNMRLQSCSSPSNVDEIKEFGDWTLNVGNGDVGEDNDGEASIEIPDDMSIGDSEYPFRDLLEFVYPDLLSNMYDRDYFQGRAILAPTNKCVESVNDHLMSLLPGEEKVYLSSDSMCRDEQTTEDNAEIYSTEFLNTIRCSGVPSHALKIK